MNAMFDAVASAVIGGMVLVLLLGFNSTIVDRAVNQTFKVMVQTRLTSMTDILEYDLRKMGYGLQGGGGTTDTNYIITGDTNKIVFRGDVDDNGTIDTVTYSLGAVPDASKVNPRARVLYRTVNGSGTRSINLAITRMAFLYYDKQGAPLTGSPVSNPERIKSFKVLMSLESDAPYDKNYSGGCWERTIKPKNIR